MKSIGVIIPSKDSEQSAGVRIRYIRLKPYFKERGIDLYLEPITTLSAESIKGKDLLIISKVFNAESLNLMAHCNSQRILVGVDLFDDYFSDEGLAPFEYHREWLRHAALLSDFFICSTDNMKSVCSEYINKGCIHQINDTKDPLVSWNIGKRLLKEKAERRAKTKQLKIVWFGIGDNPYFEVGIRDLYAYSNSLLRMRGLVEEISFNILTNKRALDPNNLPLIAHLPIRTELSLWSESSETAALKEADIAFMPVSHQKFSVVKSNNRCMTALTYGCQVISTGFPLYEEFNDYIYQNSSQFLADIESNTFKLNEKSLEKLEEYCKSFLNPRHEVRNFSTFLNSLPRNMRCDKPRILIIVHFRTSVKHINRKPANNVIAMHWSLAKKCRSNNAWITKISGMYYVEMTEEAYKLLSPSVKAIGTRSSNKDLYCIRVEDINLPNKNQNGIRNILRFRFEKKGYTVRDTIRDRVSFIYVKDDIQSLIEFLWGSRNIFYDAPKSAITLASLR
jgi:hypothetical protein